MWSWLLPILSPLKRFWGYIAAAVGALAIVFLYGQRKKSEGRHEVEYDSLKKATEIKDKQAKVKKPDPDDLDDTLSKL